MKRVLPHPKPLQGFTQHHMFMRTPLRSLSSESKTGRCTANRSGFTLVELLVVVAILAILMMVGAAVFSGTQKNARDTKRRADIEAISKAMEANYGGTRYAALADEMFASGKVPQDPLTGAAGATACSGAQCDYCSKTTAVACVNTGGAGGDAKVAVGVPGAGASYVVCANLEAGGFFCLKSQQQD